MYRFIKRPWLPMDEAEYFKAIPPTLKILKKWGWSDEEQASILGFESDEDFQRFKQFKLGDLIAEHTLFRMSYIISIHHSLFVLFSGGNSTWNWINKPNTHAFFQGRSAKQKILNGDMSDLKVVADYLLCERYN